MATPNRIVTASKMNLTTPNTNVTAPKITLTAIRKARFSFLAVASVLLLALLS